MQVLRLMRTSKHPLRLFISRVLWRTRLCQAFRINKEKYRLIFYPSSLSAAYWEDPDTRQFDHDFIAQYLKQGDIYVDIGANIGALSLEAATAVGHRGRVYAFEPHPRIYRYLVGNIKLNKIDTISPYNLALGSQPGILRFSDEIGDDQNSVTEKSGISVTVDTLDNLLSGETKTDIALVKIDVEGYEKFVCEGGGKILSQAQCIYFEAWDHHYAKYGYTTSDIINLLGKLGFTVYRREGERWIDISTGYSTLSNENLYAIRNMQEFQKRMNFVNAAHS